MRSILLLILVTVANLFLIETTLCQPAIQWQKTIGGNMGDGLEYIEQTTDGGYITCGSSLSNISGDKTENSIGFSDYWVVKLDSMGGIQWQNTIGGDNSDEVRVIHQTTDGGYILGGSSLSGQTGDKSEGNIGTYDYWIVKLNSAGVILWQNTIGGDEYDYLQSVIQTYDGGYVAAGYSYSGISGDKTENYIGFDDFWIVKMNSNGVIQWQNTIGGTGNDELHSIAETNDNGFIVGGNSYSGISGDKTENAIGNVDYWILKLDSTGVVQWDNTIGGTGFDWLNDISQTNSGNYILAGYSDSRISGDKTEDSLGVGDNWILELDNAGNILWQNVIGGAKFDCARSIRETMDGGYILGGWSRSDSSADKSENNIDSTLATSDYWIIRLDSIGNIVWENTIGGLNFDNLAIAVETADEGFILGGTSASDASGDKSANSIFGSSDYWIVKIYPDVSTGIAHATGVDKSAILLYPNPASTEIQIQHSGNSMKSIAVYNSYGALVCMNEQDFTGSSVRIDISSFSTGIYFVKVSTASGQLSTRFIKD